MKTAWIGGVVGVGLGIALSGSAAAQVAAVDDEGWLALEAVGVSADVPAPFVSPEEPPLLFEDLRGARIARYLSATDSVRFALAAVDDGVASPREIALALHEPVEEPLVTYEVDRSDLGVVSGYDGAIIFYNACKRRSGGAKCFSLTYPEGQRALIDPAIGRVLRSLR